MYKNLFRADTLIIKRALKQYVKNISIYSDDYHSIKRIIKELNEPSRDADIHAEVVDFIVTEDKGELEDVIHCKWGKDNDN